MKTGESSKYPWCTTCLNDIVAQVDVRGRKFLPVDSKVRHAMSSLMFFP